MEGAVADPGELDVGGLLAVGEVRIAVPELLGEIELEARGELGGARDRVPVVREALGCLGRRLQDAVVVPAPLALAAVERGAVRNRDERVLERRAAGMVRVRVAGGDRLDAQFPGKVAQECVAARVSPLVGALQLDEEAIASEGVRSSAGGSGSAPSLGLV